jgi:hypothetical protein
MFKKIRRSVNVGGNLSGGDPSEEIPIKEQIIIFRKECEGNPPYFDGKQEWILEK